MTSPVDYKVTQGVAVLTVDHPPVNALSHAVRDGLMAALRQALADDGVRAIILSGGATGTFLAGADLKEMGTPKAMLWPRSLHVQKVLEESPKPVIAAIGGSALGGGLEMAMACHARIVTASAELGLPEVKLGLQPGAGGTVRLPRLIGPQAALDLILSGNPVKARRALELGIIDAIVDDLDEAALAFARTLAAADTPPPTIARDERLRDVDPQIFADARQATSKRARGQTAPAKIIDCVEAACRLPAEEALEFERAAFQELLAGDQRKALIRIFFAEREARKIPGVPTETVPLPVDKAAIIGAGLMGGGIAMAFANAGIPVTLLDVDEAALSRGLGLIEKNYAQSVARGSLPQERMDAAMARITTTVDYDRLGDVDLAIEAAFERMELKQQIFARLDAALPAHAILGSNTSSLDIDQITAATGRPEQVIGMHFFSPAHVMKLLENVRGAKSSAQTIATAMAIGRRLGKAAVLAGNCEGFIGNRMLHFYGSEAEFMLEEGAPPAQIDGVAEAFGMAMGPLAMRDLAGLELSAAVRPDRRKRRPGEPLSFILERLVEAGRFGQKNGRGFYRYEGRTRLPDPAAEEIIAGVSRELGLKRRSFDDDEIRRRLFYPLANEGARAIEDGIALRASDIDLVWTRGYGFPTHRGGPMFWGEAEGFGGIIETMAKLSERNGARWRPAPLLERLERAGKGFAAADEMLRA